MRETVWNEFSVDKFSSTLFLTLSNVSKISDWISSKKNIFSHRHRLNIERFLPKFTYILLIINNHSQPISVLSIWILIRLDTHKITRKARENMGIKQTNRWIISIIFPTTENRPHSVCALLCEGAAKATIGPMIRILCSFSRGACCHIIQFSCNVPSSSCSPFSVLSFFSFSCLRSSFSYVCLSSISVKQVTLSQEIRISSSTSRFLFLPSLPLLLSYPLKLIYLRCLSTKESPCNMSSYHRNIQRGEQFNWKIHHQCIFVLSDVFENHHMCDKRSDSCAVEFGNEKFVFTTTSYFRVFVHRTSFFSFRNFRLRVIVDFAPLINPKKYSFVKMSESQVRQNFHEDCEEALNRQINMELYASYYYMSLVRMKRFWYSRLQINVIFQGLSLWSRRCCTSGIPWVFQASLRWGAWTCHEVDEVSQ